MTRLPFPVRRVAAGILAAALVAASGCSAGAPEEATGSGGDTAAPEARPEVPSRSYHRSIVFLTPSDSLLVVPWILESRVRAGGVDRTARAWLYRSGAWEPFLDQAWASPPTRFPWRILPHGPLRIVVGAEDALERIVYDESPRMLEVRMEGALTEWSGPRGGVFQLLEGSLVLAERRVTGLVLDASRTLGEDDPPPGDWIVLASGDSLQAVIQRPTAAEPRGGPEAEAEGGSVEGYRAWARLDFRPLQWSTVRVGWEEVRAYQEARRDVPTAWTLTADEGGLEGSLTSLSAQLSVTDTTTAQRPLEGLYAVEGTLVVEGGEYPVRGLLRHRQR